MSPSPTDVLLVGYGNPGRLDDGLGPALAEAVQGMALPGVTVEVDYQLNVEHAALAVRYRHVLFVDAAVDGPEPFTFRRLQAAGEAAFTTHSLQPEAVLAMAGELFGARPEGFVLGIRGYDFSEFGEHLSPGALTNLAAALRFLLPVLEGRGFRDAAEAAAAGQTLTTER
ncbi:MAG: hydrogenase maturation protease [Candidatus Latescibacterota bacterium]